MHDLTAGRTPFEPTLQRYRDYARQRQMTLSDVARATDLPKPSVRRALYTLTCLGMAASDGRTSSGIDSHRLNS